MYAFRRAEWRTAMKSMKTFAAAAFLVATAAIGSAAAQNQTPQQGPWGGPMMGQWGPRGSGEYGFMGPGMMGYAGMGPWMMGQGGFGPAMCGAMAGHIDGRLAYIRAELKITDAQEPLWKTYADAARTSSGTMLARCSSMIGQRSSTVSVPDRLDQNEQLLAAQLDAVRAMNKALKPLYAAFSDSQKQRADQILWGPMGMM
jgi:hypothetical protein